MGTWVLFLRQSWCILAKLYSVLVTTQFWALTFVWSEGLFVYFCTVKNFETELVHNPPIHPVNKTYIESVILCAVKVFTFTPGCVCIVYDYFIMLLLLYTIV